MRKGINLANGEWINFMNAGDIFENENIIEHIFKQNVENVSLIYGDYAVQYETYREIIKAENLNELWTSVRFCHQSAFYRKNVLEKFPFSDGLIAADFEQAWKIYRAGYAFFYFPQVIARFAHTGVSARTKKRIQNEIEAIICKDDKRLSTKMKFFLRKMRVRIVETVREILPTQFFEFLQKIKTKIFAGKKQVY